MDKLARPLLRSFAPVSKIKLLLKNMTHNMRFSDTTTDTPISYNKAKQNHFQVSVDKPCIRLAGHSRPHSY